MDSLQMDSLIQMDSPGEVRLNGLSDGLEKVQANGLRPTDTPFEYSCRLGWLKSTQNCKSKETNTFLVLNFECFGIV